MNLKGVKIDFLGDSITFGLKTSNESRRFTNIIAEKSGAICQNYGISGTRIAKSLPPDKTVSNKSNFCERYKKLDPTADYIVVFGGTNDFGLSNPLGCESDSTIFTFCGALNTLYNGLREHAPAAKIIFITPLHRQTETQKPVNDAGSSLADYVNAVKSFAANHGCPVLDLYTKNAFDLRKPEDREIYGPDGLHPIDAGHAVLADEILEFFDKL